MTPTPYADPGFPLRPDEAPGARREERRWLPLLCVLAVIAVIVLGGYITAGALSEPAGPPVSVPGVVSVRPLSGWEFAGRDTVTDARFFRLTRGNGNLDVLAFTALVGAPTALAQRYVDQVLGAELKQLSVSNHLQAVHLASGRPGVRFSYVGVTSDSSESIEGEVTVVMTSSGGVVFDGWAPEGLLQYALGDVHTMIDRAVVAA